MKSTFGEGQLVADGPEGLQVQSREVFFGEEQISCFLVGGLFPIVFLDGLGSFSVFGSGLQA